jgi:hypothetical protein
MSYNRLAGNDYSWTPILCIGHDGIMKNNNGTPNTLKYGFRPPEAAEVLGSEKLLAECVTAGWIKPVIKRHKLTLYDRADIASCWTRLLAGEVPTQKQGAS